MNYSRPFRKVGTTRSRGGMEGLDLGARGDFVIHVNSILRHLLRGAHDSLHLPQQVIARSDSDKALSRAKRGNS